MTGRLVAAAMLFTVLGAAVAGLWAALPLGELALAGLVAVLAAAPFAAWGARSFLRPLRVLRAGTERIGSGQFGHQIRGGTWAESRRLADDFNRMSSRLAEQFDQLETDRQQLRAILDGMAEGLVAVDGEEKLLFANDNAGKMLRFEPEAMTGRPLWEATRNVAIQRLLSRALRTHAPAREEVDANGTSARSLAVSVAPLALETAGAIIVMQDTTELRRLERLRQEFVANVSHELKTPLAIIQSHVEALLDGAADDPEVRRPFLDQIADESARLYALILDMLRLAAIESHDEVLSLEPVPLADAIDACRERHARRAEAKDVRIELVPPGDERLDVLADDDGLGQILDNLVDNAVKYSPAGAAVTISWGGTASGASFSVADRGPGIPERDLPRIFERFYRVDKARSRELGGTGLGLAIVKHLAQAMKGHVKVASAVGEGTTFTVTLPKAAMEH
jgi:two-component system phosphate regulon sensor histidine kinase PhoR